MEQSRKRTKFWSRLPNITSLVIFALLLSLYITPFPDLDFGILIRLGELILRTGLLRPPESFSYTIGGADVPDFEWLFEIIIWAVWTVLGYGGLKFFKTVLVASTLVVVGLRLRSEGVRWHGIALSLGFAVLIGAGSWNLRPLYFTTLGLVLVSWWLRDHCIGGEKGDRHHLCEAPAGPLRQMVPVPFFAAGRRRLTWWLVPVMLVWANVHPGVITGQGLLVGAIAWEWFNYWLFTLRARRAARNVNKSLPHMLNPPLDRPALHRLTLIGGLGVAATFVSPDPIERLLAPFRPELRHPIQGIFREMKPLYEVAFTWPNLDGLVYVLAALLLLTVVLRFRAYRMWEIALLLGLAGLANLAVRSLQDWLLIMLCLGVPQMARLLRQAANQRRRLGVKILLRLDRSCKALLLSPLFRFQWRWPVFALAALGVVSLIPPLSAHLQQEYRERDPAAAADWIEKHLLPAEKPLRIFGPPDYGAYLVWRLGDQVRDYVDTRGFIFPPELMQDADELPQLKGDWRTRLERVLDPKLGTEYFLLETTGPRGALWQQELKGKVQPLFADENSVLLKAEAVRKAVLAK